MYREIIENIPELEMYKCFHLGIFTEPYLKYMLDGKKIIESRFSKKKILPYNNITKDDIVIVKKSGGDIVAYFTIKDIMFFDLDKTNIDMIKDNYGVSLCVGADFFESKKDSKYATLIFIDKIIKVKPFHVNKKGMNTWLIIKED